MQNEFMGSTFSVVLCGTRVACAALVAAIGAAPAWAGEWRLDPHLEGELDSVGYFRSIDSTNQALEKFRLSAPSTLKYQRSLKFKIDPVFQASPLDDSKRERYWVELPEGYVQLQAGATIVQIGVNVFTWGVTDGFNPLDVVSARRYEDPLRSEKLGAPSVSLKQSFGKFDFEGIYIPWQRKPVLPGEHSRWLPRGTYQTSTTTGGLLTQVILPASPAYSYVADDERDHALSNNFGARLQGSGVAPGLDFSLEAFQGAAPTPAIDPTLGGKLLSAFPVRVIQLTSGIALKPIEYRQWVYGGTVTYAALGSIFRFETAITRVISKSATLDLPGSVEEYVGGVERSFPLGHDSLTLLLQGTYARHYEAASSAATSLGRMFDRALLLGARYPFSERLSVLASALLDTKYHGELAHVEGSYALTDSLKASLVGEGLWGPLLTPLGTYSANSRAILILKASI